MITSMIVLGAFLLLLLIFHLVDYGQKQAEAQKLIEKKELCIQKLRDKLHDDVQTLYNTILALNTKKRVLEELPDLQPYFPAEITTALAPNLSAVRDLLKR